MARVPTIVRQRYGDDEIDTPGCRYKIVFIWIIFDELVKSPKII
jgi:hypothetical protein